MGQVRSYAGPRGPKGLYVALYAGKPEYEVVPFVSMASGENLSSAGNQQEIPWIVRNREFLKELEAQRAVVARSTRGNADEILVLLDEIRDTAMGIDVLTPEQGEEHTHVLIDAVNRKLSPFSHYLS